MKFKKLIAGHRTKCTNPLSHLKIITNEMLAL